MIHFYSKRCQPHVPRQIGGPQRLYDRRSHVLLPLLLLLNWRLLALCITPCTDGSASHRPRHPLPPPLRVYSQTSFINPKPHPGALPIPTLSPSSAPPDGTCTHCLGIVNCFKKISISYFSKASSTSAGIHTTRHAGVQVHPGNHTYSDCSKDLFKVAALLFTFVFFS